MRLTQGSLPPREERGLFVGNFSFKSRSSPANALLPSSPLRTVRESFPSHSSSPSNASFRETRFRDRNVLAMNPVMALWMKYNSVLGALRTTHHTANAVVQAPARDPSDFCIAHSAEPALFMPEKAKRASTPKRFFSGDQPEIAACSLAASVFH